MLTTVDDVAEDDEMSAKRDDVSDIGLLRAI